MVESCRSLVVHPPLTVARDFIDYPYFADLGAVQLASVLGPQAKLVDAFALPGASMQPRDDGRFVLGASVAQTLHAAGDDWDVAVVAYTPFHRPPHRDDVLASVLQGLARLRPGAPIILADLYQSGQHYVQVVPAAVHQSYPEIDAWVRYEGEATVPQLLEAWLSDGQRPSGTHDGARPDLATLPAPAWDRIDLDAYDRFHHSVIAAMPGRRWAFPIDGRTLPIITSRGCPFRCAHCSSNPDVQPGQPKTQRRRPTQPLEADIRRLSDLGSSRVFVLDELVNVNAAHLDTVLDAVEAHDLAFEVPNGMRADYLQRGHLARMHGRVTTVSISAESGSARVVADIVGKQLDLAEIDRVAEQAHRAGVALMIHWMIGLPGESAVEINTTLSHALRLWDQYRAWPAVQYATPLPGTRLATSANALTVVDWGPRFQTEPSPTAATVDAATLRAFRDTFDARLAASQGPDKLIVNVTYACNNRCTFCAVGTRTQLDGHPTRQREHLMRHRRRGVTMVDFDGGEPTLHPDLIGLVRYAKAIGYQRINVTTNGRMCAYPEYAQRLVRSGVTTVLFSIHGADARSHGHQVGVPEAFEQSMAGIEHCRAVVDATDGPDVELGMNVTVTKGNVDALSDIAALCLSSGLRWLNIQFLTPFGRATSRVAPETQHAAEVAMGVIDRFGDQMKLQIINLPYCFMPGYESYMAGDMAKLSRHMVFVNNEEVNLAEYLAERRVRKPVCEPCPHACFCGGFYEMDDAPEPPWLVSADDLVRRVEP